MGSTAAPHPGTLRPRGQAPVTLQRTDRGKCSNLRAVRVYDVHHITAASARSPKGAPFPPSHDMTISPENVERGASAVVNLGVDGRPIWETPTPLARRGNATNLGRLPAL
ncbi:hypothetical protein JCM4914_12690 [Streptomyces platensis subsp. malvinus]